MIKRIPNNLKALVLRTMLAFDSQETWFELYNQSLSLSYSERVEYFTMLGGTQNIYQLNL